MAKQITSAVNPHFKALKELLTSKGITDQGRALIFGRKAVQDTLDGFSARCHSLIVPAGYENALPHGSQKLPVVELSPPLFKELDIFGSRAPILEVAISPFEVLPPSLPGRALYLMFQEPSNVGAVLRSAAAFGVRQILLGPGCANPFHPKSSRAASGALFLHRFFRAPSLEKLSGSGFNLVALDMAGQDIDGFKFPENFILVPGVEGPGVDAGVAFTHRITIPIASDIESLNAATATAIALQKMPRFSLK